MIETEEICSLIPHDGAMCLIDKVTEWNDSYICCETMTHIDPGNPLRNQYNLPITSLIEYGAQAMAIHGGLLAKAKNEKMQQGYLAALRDISMVDGDASIFAGPLQIEATQLMASQGNMIYQFAIKAEDTDLISGRATVVAIFQDRQGE